MFSHGDGLYVVPCENIELCYKMYVCSGTVDVGGRHLRAGRKSGGGGQKNFCIYFDPPAMRWSRSRRTIQREAHSRANFAATLLRITPLRITESSPQKTLSMTCRCRSGFRTGDARAVFRTGEARQTGGTVFLRDYPGSLVDRDVGRSRVVGDRERTRHVHVVPQLFGLRTPTTPPPKSRKDHYGERCRPARKLLPCARRQRDMWCRNSGFRCIQRMTQPCQLRRYPLNTTCPDPTEKH